MLLAADNYVVYANVIALLLAIWVSSRLNSPFIAIASLAISNLLSGWMLHEMIQRFGTHVELIRHLWYLGFVVVDLLTIIAIIYVHDKFGLAPGKLSKTVIFSFAVLATLQLSEYIPRIALNLSTKEMEQLPVLPELYSYGISSINVTMGVLALSITVYAAGMKYYNKRIAT